MRFPAPEPGLVIRYSYLWRREADRGLEEGRKDRPCVVVLAVRLTSSGLTVLVAPITHTPSSDEDAVEIPPATKRRLGLDDDRSWVVTTEVNAFVWPGPDLRPIDEQRGVTYGVLPAKLTARVLDALRTNRRAARLRNVSRSP